MEDVLIIAGIFMVVLSVWLRMRESARMQRSGGRQAVKKECPCGCGKRHSPLPPGCWLSYIGTWHRVRLVWLDGPDGDSEEIGCGDDPDNAAKEAWAWWLERGKRATAGRCWYCNDAPDWSWEWPEGKAPSCRVCGRRANKELSTNGGVK